MLTLTDEQKVSLSISPVTAAGNKANLDGPAIWSSSNPDIVSISASADGLSAVATAVGPIGNSQISVSADADLGAGVRTIAAILDVTVVAAEAVSLSVNAGTPELK